MTKIARNILICLLLGALNSHAQLDQYKFERISIQEGLSQSSVNCIVQDHKGFLWIGTQDGLNKYDGYNFIVYRHNYLKPNSISDNNIIAMNISPNGDLWIGTEAGGLNRFNPNSDDFTRFTHSDGKNSLSDNYVWAITNDNNGNLWIATRNGLNKFNPGTNQFTVFKNDPANEESISDNEIFDVLADNDGFIWAATPGGLNRCDITGRKFQRFLNIPHSSQTLNSNTVTSIHQDKNGLLWVGTFEGVLHSYNKKDGTFNRYTISYPESLEDEQSIVDIKDDKNGNIWIGTSAEGLFCFDKAKKTFTPYRYNNLNLNSLGSNEILTVFIDNEGIIWAGTYGSGLSKLDIHRQQFPHYKYISRNLNNNIENAVFSFCEDNKGNIWIGSSGGLNLFDLKSKTMVPYVYRPGEKQNKNNYIHAIYVDKKDNLWIGTYGKGLDKYSLKTKTFKNYKLSNANIVAILEDEEGYLWLGDLAEGLIKFDPKSEKSIRFKHIEGESNCLSSNEIQTLIMDKSQTLWIGTVSGITKLNIKTNQFNSYKFSPENPEGLSHNIVMSICQDQNDQDILWIGTSGGGLNKFSKHSGKCFQYTEGDGLPNNMIYGILSDTKGYLWLSTNYGLSRFNPSTKTFKNFDEDDGLQSNEFNQYAFYKTRNGDILFGGLDGFNLFSPELIKETKYVSPVVITDFKKFNKSVKFSKPIYEIDKLNLSYKDYVFSFEFSTLSFSRSKKNQYAYKLEGFDSDWIYCGNNRTATYTNLSPGEYVFKVKAANSTGTWNQTGTSLNIIITPPFWDTTIFRILFVSFFVLLAFFIYKKRVHYIENLNKKLERLIKERTKKLHEEITNRIKIESSLRENEERFRALIENAYDAVIIINDTGIIKYASPAFEKIYGYKTKAVNGYSVFEKNKPGRS